jgi:hypothetical protein
MTTGPQFDWAGVIFYLVLAAAWGMGAYWLWPDGVTDIPISRLTLGLLVKAGGAVLMGILAIASIFGAITDAFD